MDEKDGMDGHIGGLEVAGCEASDMEDLTDLIITMYLPKTIDYCLLRIGGRRFESCLWYLFVNSAYVWDREVHMYWTASRSNVTIMGPLRGPMSQSS